MNGGVVAEECRTATAHSSRAGLMALFRIAMPLVVSRAGLAAMTIADGWMVARSDAGQLALTSLAGGTFGRLTEVFAAFTMAALPLVASASGSPDAGRSYWRRAAVAALPLGLAGLGVAAFSPQMFRFMIEDPDLARRAGAVVWILSLGLPAGLVALASAMYLEGRRRPALVAGWVLAANGLNIALNWLLIGGHAGFPAWGAYGSALGTTIVRVALAAALLLTLLRREGKSLFKVHDGESAGARAHWRLAISAGGTTAGFHALAIWLTIFAGWLGPQALAAYASCWLLTMPAMLLAVGVGDAIGLRTTERDHTAATLWRDLSALAVLLAPFGLIMIAAPDAVTALYTADPALRTLMARLLPFGGTVLLLDGLSYGLAAAMRARGDVIGSTAIQLGTMAATPLLAAVFTFGCDMGLRGLVLAILCTSTGRLVLLLQRLDVRKSPPPVPQLLLGS